MQSEDNVATAENENDVEKLSVVSRLITVFHSPGKVFENIREYPGSDWVVPFILISIFALVFTFMTYDIIMAERFEQVRTSNPNMTEEQLNTIQEQQSGPIAQTVGLIAVPIVTIISWVIVAALLLFGGNFILGGQSSFGRVLSMFGYTSAAVGIIETAVKLPLVLSQKTMAVQTSLALVLSPDSKEEFIYKLLAQFDLFRIWQIALLIIGMAVLYRIAQSKAAGLVITYYVIFIAGVLTIQELFSGFF